MKRSRAFTIAAVILAVYCFISVLFQIPSLALGANVPTDGPPFFIAVVNFALDILGFVAVYGVLRVQKWGVVLAIAVGTLFILTSELPAIIFAPSLGLRIAGVVSVVALATMIVLLLRPAGNSQRAVGEASLSVGQPTTARAE